jgi:asparagine synthase (glutamine-hydrolysing)
MSMAHSIESRVPLLDNKVIAFASSLPAALKIRDGRRKHVLKEFAATLLPPEVLARPKQGFGVPLGVWFRGNLRELFADTLTSARSRQRGYFQPRFIDRLITEHLKGTRDHTLRLWQLVVFERWHQQYVDAEDDRSSVGLAERDHHVAAEGTQNRGLPQQPMVDDLEKRRASPGSRANAQRLQTR